ncbi:MAG: bifunctional oligoribonuclease/PAP phosphatase NrnA [Capsulimonadaceae bacterium]|nr:bifunctional oligoribonuclease/PAP phosphatase NrnA [Capsulimonadaceae bacterium]
MTTEEYQDLETSQRTKAAAAIRAASKIAMACHVNPDGDALGSMLGLGLAIEAGFPDKQVTMLAQDGVPFIYRFLPGSDRIVTRSGPLDLDLAIVVDSGDIARVGKSIEPIISSAQSVLDIDHHIGEGSFGSVRLLDNRAAATAEIIFDLLVELDLPITQAIATCLFTGVITDTGSFRFMNVTPRTLRVAASLIEFGASPALIAEQVFDNRPFEATRLMGLALSTLSSTPDGRVTWATVSREAFDQAGASDEDTEGFVNPVRAVRGTEVAILFREVAKGRVRISLRSTEHVDVSHVAGKFGGGGHRMASGCSYEGSLDEAVAALVAAVNEALPRP